MWFVDLCLISYNVNAIMLQCVSGLHFTAYIVWQINQVINFFLLPPLFWLGPKNHMIFTLFLGLFLMIFKMGFITGHLSKLHMQLSFIKELIIKLNLQIKFLDLCNIFLILLCVKVIQFQKCYFAIIAI